MRTSPRGRLGASADLAMVGAARWSASQPSHGTVAWLVRL